MKLAFYYHIPIFRENEKIYMPGYLGVFIDSLAAEVEKLVIVMHEAKKNERSECDYVLSNNNIFWVNLGLKTPAWHRTFSLNFLIRNKLKTIEFCDVFVVRSPTPLAVKLHKYVNKPHLFFMIVGNYVEDSGHLKTSNLRDRIIYKYLKYFDSAFTKRIRLTDVIVNSPLLYQKYLPFAKSIELIRTTTLSEKDFYFKEDTCLTNSIRVLYTGRIDRAKGLTELVKAICNLHDLRVNIKLNIVGWETNPLKPYEEELMLLASSLGKSECIQFHGKKRIGNELNEEYRGNDIYVMPSYYEGFPRTIWEAMANSLPVIATNVGGIPGTLTNNENVLLIEPRSSREIETAILELIKNEHLRKKIIKSAFDFVSEVTLEKQTRKTVFILKRLVPNKGL